MNPIEVIFLERTNGSEVGTKFPGYYEYRYEINPNKLLEWALKKKFLQCSDVNFNVSKATISDLKPILNEFGLKTTGKKADLVKSLCENVERKALEERFPQNYYQLTDEGKKIVADNEYAVFYHKNKYLVNEITLEKFFRAVASDKENYLETAIKIINDKSWDYRNSGDWGLYRNTFLAMADLHSKKKNYEEALNSISKICILDLSGLGNNNSFSKNNIFLAPGVFNLVDKYGSKNKTDIGHFAQLNEKNFKELALPRCKLKLDDINEVVITSINDFEAGNALIKKKLRSNIKTKKIQVNKHVVIEQKDKGRKKKSGLTAIIKNLLNI
ncbi:SAP domain-containing protein [Acidaminobacter sp. JC074]|uniref:SAP domain-containing protein n=1 Tax=Acidaminobacter sp. JC074 TaxID=2530199 RepID=UPI001F0EC45F|nr:SAP domain-containing protein [Acidaminobacter sp. JC074]